MPLASPIQFPTGIGVTAAMVTATITNEFVECAHRTVCQAWDGSPKLVCCNEYPQFIIITTVDGASTETLLCEMFTSIYEVIHRNTLLKIIFLSLSLSVSVALSRCYCWPPLCLIRLLLLLHFAFRAFCALRCGVRSENGQGHAHGSLNVDNNIVKMHLIKTNYI